MRRDQKITRFNNFKEIVSYYESEYNETIAFKYKKNAEAKVPEYINITYSQFKKDIEALSTKLLNMGLQGKKVAIISPNRYEWCVSYLAVTTGDMVIVPLDKSLPSGEIKNLIKRSQAECVIFDEHYLEVFEEIKKEDNTNLQYYICMDYKNTKDSVLGYMELLNGGRELVKNGDAAYRNIEIDPEKLSIILFTSGTTSAAKAVMLCQRNICSNINEAANAIYLDTNDTLLSFLPLHHTFESTTTFLLGTSRGVTIAFCDGLKHIASNLKEYKITGFVCVPLMIEAMYKKIETGIAKQGKTNTVKIMSKICNFLLKFGIDIRRKVFKSVLDNIGGSLRIFVSGAASINKETIVGISKFGLDFIQGYGLTETSPVLAAETDKNKRPGSVGLPLNGVEIKIDEPNELGIGEVIARGPNIMMGYYENEEATEEVLKDGWFYTGDLGYIDKDGYIFIKGRKKSVIVLKNGKNIFPEEIETLINDIPFVAESMVFGRLQEDGDYKLGVKVVYNKEEIEKTFGKIDEAEYYNIILKEVKQINKNMPPYKYVREVITTETPLIKTTTQKIKRHEEMKLIEG